MFKSSLYFIVATIISVEAAKILAFFTTPSLSHHFVYRPLVHKLAENHQVIVVTTDPEFSESETPPNITEIDVHDISYRIWRHYVVTTSGMKLNIYPIFKQAIKTVSRIFEEIIQSDKVSAVLRDEKIDLLLLEAGVKPTLSVAHITKAPIIQVYSMGAIYPLCHTVGASDHYTLNPSFSRRRIYNLTFWEEIAELYNTLTLRNLVDEFESEDDEMLKSIISDIPPLRDLQNHVSMVYLNVNPIFDDNRPAPFGLLFMGGMHLKPTKELPQDLKSFLDSSPNGVIYISFGTNIDPTLISTSVIDKFVKILSNLPYDVLWKWNKNELLGHNKNIKRATWYPQADLLKHPNVKLFITHAGLQSTDEAIDAAVPVIGVPIVMDQFFNAEKYRRFGIGLKLDIRTLTEKQLKDAIKEVIGNDSYRIAMKRLRHLMQDQKQTSLERAVWWTEYIIRHGGDHIRAPAANMPWTQYYEVELVIIVLMFVGTSVMITVCLICWVWSLVKKIIRTKGFTRRKLCMKSKN